MFFSVAGKTLSVSFSQQDTQEISQRNHSDQPSYVCDYSPGEGRGSFFLVVLSLQSFYKQLGLKCQKKSVIPRQNLYK